MFNPQRRSKPADIFMQERAFKLHIDKLNAIRSSAPLSDRTHDEQLQLKYLQRLHLSKQEVQNRLKSHIYRQNHRLHQKLNDTDRRPGDLSEQDSKQRHFNSYFNHKKETQRVRIENNGMIERMVNKSSIVPTLQQMKQDFKQSKRYGKMVRKLPAILRHEDWVKKQLSGEKGMTSRVGSNVSLKSFGQKGSRVSGERALTQEIKQFENELVQKQ